MIGGENGYASNFNEFASDELNPEEVYIKKENSRQIKKAINLLTPEEQHLITALFFDGKTERAYAKETGISQKTVNRRKTRIVNKLKTMLEKG